MNYREQEEKQLIRKLRTLLKELPEFCTDFFISIAQTTLIKTRMGYLYDLRLFFNFLTENIRSFDGKDVCNLTTDDLENVTYREIDLFLDYLSYHERNSKSIKGKNVSVGYINKENGKSRKLSAVRRLFSYLYKVGKIKSNPSELVDTPKIHKKNIIHLEKQEVINLLNEIETGRKLTDKEKEYHKHTKIRDFAIICLLLGTGMRVSECVGINIEDIDFEICGIKIVRKGGNESIVYFGQEVEDALLEYFKVREDIIPIEGNETALFLSIQKKRINVRSVQNLVKKYTKISTPLKNISPHKLRSTYGTALYEKTQDIYLVADALGHSDINTTKKYYAKMSESRRKQAAQVTRLREE